MVMNKGTGHPSGVKQLILSELDSDFSAAARLASGLLGHWPARGGGLQEWKGTLGGNMAEGG